jgi:hypothetical protein
MARLDEQNSYHRHLIGHRNMLWPVALALAFVLSNLLSWSHFGLGLPTGGAAQPQSAQAAPRPDGGGQAALGRAVVPQKIQVQWSKTMPTPSAQERQAEQAALSLKRQIKPPSGGPMYHLTAADTAALARTAGPPLPNPHTAPRADSDFNVERTAMVSSGGICPTDCSLTTEMSASAANDGQVIMMTGNYFAAKSMDNGATWSYLDPYTLTGAPNFCCDQQVLYEPSRNLMIWELEYNAFTSSPNNQLTLAVSGGTDLASWCFYSFHAADLGVTSGDIFVAPDIEYSANFLYLSFLTADGSFTYVNSSVARLPLSAMRTCVNLTPQIVARSDTLRFTLAQGATETMYWMSNFYLCGGCPTTGNHVRVFFWPEKANGYTFQDKPIDPFNFVSGGVSDCSSQDGVVTNWCSQVDSTDATLYRARAGYRGFGAPMLGMAWEAGPVNGLTTYPYVVREYFLLANMSYKGHDNLYSWLYAVAYPSLVAPTTRGYVGGIVTIGGGMTISGTAYDFYPSGILLIEDPDTPTQPWSTVNAFPGYGNANPNWGDYNTARAWTPDGLHWIVAAWRVNPSAVLEAWVGIFGRGRDHDAYLRWANT